MLPKMRGAVARMAPYQPPEDLESVGARAGVPADRLVKLDAIENPYGPSPRVAQALARFDSYHRYPDPDQKAIRPLVAAYAGVAADQIMLFNGSDEVIDLLCRIFLDPGDEVVDCTPTFGMYRFSTELAGGQVVEVERGSDWSLDVDRICAALGPRTKIIFVATPNNPSGNGVAEHQVRALADSGRLVVLDEAYVEFSGERSYVRLVQDYDNVVVLRTFSKWAGLAGLRVGYAVLSPGLAATLWKVKPPFNINLAAEIAVRATLEDLSGVQAKVRLLTDEREQLRRRLSAIPLLRVWPSSANFLLVDTLLGAASDLKAELERAAITVRAYSHPRLSNSIRISVGFPEHSDMIVTAVQGWAAEQ